MIAVPTCISGNVQKGTKVKQLRARETFHETKIPSSQTFGKTTRTLLVFYFIFINLYFIFLLLPSFHCDLKKSDVNKKNTDQINGLPNDSNSIQFIFLISKFDYCDLVTF